MSRKTTTPFLSFLVWLGFVLLVAGCSGKQMSSSVQDQTLTPGPEPVAEAPVPQPSPAPEPPVQEAELPVPEPVPEVLPQPEPVPEVVLEPEPVPEPEPGPPAEVPVEEPILQSTEEERFTPQPVPLEEEIEPVPTPEPAPIAPFAEVEEVVPEPVLKAEVPAVAEPGVPPPSLVLPPIGLNDVYFDFDRSALRTDATNTLEANAQQLLGQTGWTLTIEGHCDERGTGAYNMVLGERRAAAVKRYLEDLGVSGGNITIVSFGKEKPFCQEQSDDCYQLNRRAHFVIN